jgi:SPP1 family holin
LDKGTTIRTVLLIITLINQIAGTTLIALDEFQVNTIVEAIYLLVSVGATAAASIVAWYKNNYVTKRGKAQKAVLKAQGLEKK